MIANKPSFYEIITAHAVNNCSSGCGVMKAKTITSCGGWGGGACGLARRRPVVSCGGGGSGNCGGGYPWNYPPYTGGGGSCGLPRTRC